MLESKIKNNLLLYVELLTKILHYTGYPFSEEEPIFNT